MDIDEKKLDFFMENFPSQEFYGNDGGMGFPDLFSFYLALDELKPKVVIESGVWNGISTKLIRKVLPEAHIICLDPREIPSYGYKDNSNSTYYTGKLFIDFSQLNLSSYNKDEILCFFDDHQNAVDRLSQCIKKNIKHVFFNDNYPLNCGSHYTLEHYFNNDSRHSNIYLPKDFHKNIEVYKIFPNIYPGMIKTCEGYFECKSYYEKDNDKYPIFKLERSKYRWNTYVKLKT